MEKGKKMSRYIDADKLRKDVLDLPNCYNGFSDTYDKAMIIDLIDEQPTVDAKPVRHGHWIKANDPMSSPFDTMKRCLCSECREWAAVTSYCPNCGAKMDDEENE